MKYLITKKGCSRCDARKAELNAKGVPFVEVSDADPHYTQEGEKVSSDLLLELLTEMSIQGGVLPIEVDWP